MSSKRIEGADTSAQPGSAERARWLMDELGTYLADRDADAHTRDEIARRTLRNGHASFERFITSRYAPMDVICAEVSIHHVDGGICRTAYRHSPDPVAFLFLCATSCRDGDLVTLRQVTAQSGSVTANERWPFGLACAERMTLPAPARLHAVAPDAMRVRRREGTLGRRRVAWEWRTRADARRYQASRVTDADGARTLRVSVGRREVRVAIRPF